MLDFNSHGPNPSAALISRRSIYAPEGGNFEDAPVYERDLLRPGNQIAGPAVIAQFDSTTLVLAGQVASVDQFFNLVIIEGDAE